MTEKEKAEFDALRRAVHSLIAWIGFKNPAVFQELREMSVEMNKPQPSPHVEPDKRLDQSIEKEIHRLFDEIEAGHRSALNRLS